MEKRTGCFFGLLLAAVGLFICLPAARGQEAFFRDSTVVLRSNIFLQANPTSNQRDEVYLYAWGLGGDFISGWAWDMLGFDLSGGVTAAWGRGRSEMTRHDYLHDKDRSKAILTTAAPKIRLSSGHWGLTGRGGFTRLDVGTIGTSWRMHSHAYRGFEVSGSWKDLRLGYAWADRFMNDWDYMYREMTNSYFQKRTPHKWGDTVDYIHSVGLVWNFGYDGAGYVDMGAGEGKDFRKNAQLAVSVPLPVRPGVLYLESYFHWGKYDEKLYYIEPVKDEYHLSATLRFVNEVLRMETAFAATKAPNSREMLFGLAAYSNADKRSFSPVNTALDEFAWHGLRVLRAGVSGDLGRLAGLTGFSAGLYGNYGWNLKVDGRRGRGKMSEVDYYLAYAFEKGMLDGLMLTVTAGHLRSSGFYTDGYGKQSQDLLQVEAAYVAVF